LNSGIITGKLGECNMLIFELENYDFVPADVTFIEKLKGELI